jgi:hypothetical protein
LASPSLYDPNLHRREIERERRIAELPPWERPAIRTATDPAFRTWLHQVEKTGGCENPVHLVGHTSTYDTVTGERLHVFTSTDLPHGQLLVACGNRRASRCRPCSWLHQGDTYQLILSGLTGGKTVPTSVSAHPFVFATLTAPSFGTVHGVHGICRPRRAHPRCGHGWPAWCSARHDPDDPAVGTPLCGDCYDYPAAVLFNAHAGVLWNEVTHRITRYLAAAAGIPVRSIGRHVRVSYAKVAEYQRRGVVHLHAVLRLDGPAGPAEPPPARADTGLLQTAVRHAATTANVAAPASDAYGAHRLRFGPQVDVRTITLDDGDGGTSAHKVAAYVAKYVTKGDLPGIVADSPIRHRSGIELVPVSEHARTLMRACWRLGGLPEYEKLKLRRWVHQLGYRGHIASKSRAYSTTYTSLRAARVLYRAGTGEPVPGTVAVDSDWRYVGRGYSDGQAPYAEAVTGAVMNIRELRAQLRATGECA